MHCVHNLDECLGSIHFRSRRRLKDDCACVSVRVGVRTAYVPCVYVWATVPSLFAQASLSGGNEDQ